MNLHRVGKRADWQLITPEARNRWQRIAALTGGMVTPANILSIAGGLLVGWGLWQLTIGRLVAGLVAIGIGRLADVFDGMLADKTGTKSPLGEAFDIITDKLAIAAILIVFIWQAVLPLWALLSVAIISVLNSICGIVIKTRKLEVHSSKFGKYSTAGLWAALLLYGAGAAAYQTSWYVVVQVTANIVMIISLGTGYFALFEYARAAFGQRSKVAKSAAVPFTRFLVVQNPVSTNARVGARYTAELRKLFPEVACEVIPTPPGGREAIRTMLADHADRLGPTTLLCIAGGDGTANTVIEFLLTAGNLPPEARRTPVLPLWGGNGNDLATMLNGLGALLYFKNIITRGKIVPIYPLECSMRIKHKGKLVRLAANSLSFGASANIARRLDEPARRRSWLNRWPGGRMVQSYLTGTLAWFEARPFLITEHGMTYPAYDRIFANGWRAAGLTIAPVDLANNEFYLANYKSNRIVSLFRHVVDIIDRRSKHTRSRPVRFTLGAPTWAQFDGEVIELEAQTKLAIRLAREPFYALSTKTKIPKAVYSAGFSSNASVV